MQGGSFWNRAVIPYRVDLVTNIVCYLLTFNLVPEEHMHKVPCLVQEFP